MNVTTIQEQLETRAHLQAVVETRKAIQVLPCLVGSFEVWSNSENKVVQVGWDRVLVALEIAMRKSFTELRLRELTQTFMANFDRINAKDNMEE